MKLWKPELKKEPFLAGFFLFAVATFYLLWLIGFLSDMRMPGVLGPLTLLVNYLGLLMPPVAFFFASRFYFRLSKSGSLVSLIVAIILVSILSFTVLYDPCPADMDTHLTANKHAVCGTHGFYLVLNSFIVIVSVLFYIIVSAILDFLESRFAKASAQGKKPKTPNK